MSSPRRRAGGRRDKHLQRRAGPANPCPPGQIGGQYGPLTESELQAIYKTALRLLAELGMGEVPARLRADLLRIGAVESADGRVCLPNALVEDVIAKAPGAFVLHGRDEARSIEIGGSRVYFGTGGAAVQTLDIDTGLYRPSTLADLHDFTRLQDTLQNVSWYTRCCVATDVPDNYELDVNTVYAMVRNTTKPLGTSFTLADYVDPIVKMLDVVAGGEGAFSKRPFLKGHISPVISPMRFGEDAVDVVYACLRHNIPVTCITAAQSGATAPATLAGFLAQSLAETLASLAMVQAIKPGHPMIFSNWPFVVDLRTGATAGGGSEVAVMSAGSAQISNWLGLPSGVASSMTDAKAIDAQYGAEKALTSLAAGLAGGNVVYESAGMTASLLGVSFEAFVLDDEMNAAIYRMMRGFEVNDDTLSFDVVCNVVRGDGHFLGDAQTYAAMERDYFYPKLADRDPPVSWAEKGAPDAWRRANEKARAILAEHHPEYLTAEQDQKIRDAMPILL